ncbi:MAG: hypothetical protein ACRCX2_28395 [Paraclostridium sp.]
MSKNKEIREIEVVFKEKGAKKLIADIESMTKLEIDASNKRIAQIKAELKAKEITAKKEAGIATNKIKIDKAIKKLDNKYSIANKKLGSQSTTYRGTKLKGGMPFASPGSIFSQGKQHPAISGYVKSAQANKNAEIKKAEYNRDWADAIKKNAEYDSKLANEKRRQLAKDLKQHKTQFKVGNDVTAVEMLQYEAKKKEYQDSLSAGFKKAKAGYEANKKASSLTPEQRLKAHKTAFKVSDSVTGADLAQYQARKKQEQLDLVEGFKAEQKRRKEEADAKEAEAKRKQAILNKMQAEQNAEERASLERGFKAEQKARAKAIDDKKKKLRKSFKFGQDRKFGIHEPRGATALVAKRKADAEQAGRDFLKARDEKRFNLGKQQQTDYFARAKSNMKKYKERQKSESLKDKASEGAISKFIDRSNGFGNAIVGMVGKLTLFVGAINMLAFTVTGAFSKMMQVGDKFAETQKTLMVGQGFRANLTNVQAMAFDRATEAYRRMSGLDSGTASAQMAMAGNTLSDIGGTLNERNLRSISMASRGAGALTGKDASEMQSVIAEVLRSGKGADKLGLKKDLRLRGSIDDRLGELVDILNKNSIAGNIMRNGTIADSMQGIRSVPNEIWSRVLGEHGGQASDIFSELRDKFEFIFDKSDVDGVGIIDEWSSVLTHFQKTVGVLFDRDSIMKLSDGASQWSKELITMGGWLFKGVEWFLNNSESVIKTIKATAMLWAGLKAFNMVRGVTQFFTLSKTIADGVAVTDWQLLQRDMGKMAGGATSMFKSFGVIAMGLAGAYMTYKDYAKGAEWAKTQKGIGSTAGGLGFAIGGSGKGAGNAFKNAGKGAMLGGAIGSIVPVIGTAIGTAVGAIIGGISGYIGGEKIAEWTQSAFDSIKSGWEALGGYITDIWGAIVDRWLSVIDWVTKKIDTVKKRLGLGGSSYGPQYTDGNGRVYNRLTRQFEDVSTPLSNTASISSGIKLTSNFNQEEYNKNVTGGLFGMPNSKIIVINGGDLSLDSRVGATEEQFVAMAGS